MKPIKTIRNFLLLAMLGAWATSCQKEEFSTTSGDAPQGTQLTINVVGGGYASINPQTRAEENGYVTKFTAGDKIGLYTVKGEVITAENICLTATDNGINGLNWTGDVPPYKERTFYFAYYPYEPSLDKTLLDPSAMDANSFFTNFVETWTPATDQSTYAQYTAQDLMLGRGAISTVNGNRVLSFTMTHTMALMVIETPVTKYTFTNDPSIPDYYTPAPNTKFYGFKPYRIGGNYRYLIKPKQFLTDNLMGSYTDGEGNVNDYKLSAGIFTAATYICYKVDNAFVAKELSHKLQEGDFYMKDGSLVSKDVATLTDEQKADCIGVVIKVGRDADGEYKDDCVYKTKDNSATISTIHGYVLGLYDIKDESGKTTFQWGSKGTLVDHPDIDRDVSNYGFYGYKSTNAIKAFAAGKSWDLKTAYPATYYATMGYEASYPAPANSSGWFLPSSAQGRYFASNKKILSISVNKATGDNSYDWNQKVYWLSSEHYMQSLNQAWCAVIDSRSLSTQYKDSEYSVRGLLVF